MIRRIILALIALGFLIPAIGLTVDALGAADIGEEEALALLVGGIALGAVALILLWIVFDMGRKSRKRQQDSDLTALGLANMMAMKDLGDDSGDDN